MTHRFRSGSLGIGVTATLAICVMALAGCSSSTLPPATTSTSTSTSTTSPTSTTTTIASTGCKSHKVDSYSQAVLSDSPLAYFRLDEASGPTMCDSSASANNGTYVSGVHFGVPGAIAGDSAVAAPSPSSGIGTGGSGSGLTGDHSFTLEAWFRSTGTARDQSLVSMGQAGEGNVAGLSTWTSDTGNGTPSQLVLDLYVGVENASTLPIWDTRAVGVNLWDGQWHHLAITYSAAADKVTGYVDGHDLGALTPVTAINLLASPIRIGYWIDTAINQGMIGDVDEVAVYPTALSPAQIQAHFLASGRSVSTSTSTSTSVPVTAKRVALGTDNPAQGACTTNTSEMATSVGSVVLNVTASSFEAEIQLQKGSPNTTYAVLMQQVPGSCPQTSDNGGTLTTDSAGRGHASPSVPRVPGASAFFLQLLPAGSGAPQFTSDRITAGS